MREENEFVVCGRFFADSSFSFARAKKCDPNKKGEMEEEKNHIGARNALFPEKGKKKSLGVCPAELATKGTRGRLSFSR